MKIWIMNDGHTLSFMIEAVDTIQCNSRENDWSEQ